MSTGHNRKRKQPRQCQYRDEPVEVFHHVHQTPTGTEGVAYVEANRRCSRFAEGASRYCADHKLRTESPEGPMGRKLRLQHQANQVAEAGKLAGKTHVKLPRWYKERAKKAKVAAAMQTFLQALVGVTFVEKVKTVAKRLNPWAK